MPGSASAWGWCALALLGHPALASAQLDPTPTTPTRAAPAREPGESQPDGTPARQRAPGSSSDSSAESAAGSTPAHAQGTLASRADQLEALLAGELPPAVDERRLFALDGHALSERFSAALVALLTRARKPRPSPTETEDDPGKKPTRTGRKAHKRTPQASAPQTDAKVTDAGLPDMPTGLTDAEARVLAALQRVAALDRTERAALFASHAKAREQYAARKQARTRRQQQIAAMDTEAEHLRAFLRGQLDLDVDPRSLVSMDLSLWPVLSPEPATTRGQDTAAHPTPHPPADHGREPDAPPPAETVKPDPAWESARQRLAEARLDLLRLSATARAELFETHGQRRRVARDDSSQQAQKEADLAERSAEEAAEARKRALKAAEEARTETQRVIAAEHARLLGVQEAQARFDAALAQRQATAGELRSAATDWQLKVRALATRSILQGPRHLEADPMYDDLADALAALRERLATLLDEMKGSELEVPSPGEQALPEQARTSMLSSLHGRLSEREAELEEKYRQQRWTNAIGLQEDMQRLNAARLQLLGWLSPQLRERYTGSGPEAVRQAYAEIQQIVLTLRMKALALPHTARRLKLDLTTAPLPVIFGFLQFLVVAALFRGWRRHADRWLGTLRRRVLSLSPPNRVSSQMATGLWYLMRIRKPLEVLALTAAIVGLFGEAGAQAGLDYVWLVVAWWMTGSAVVNLLDALAARQQLRAGGHESAALRIRSLRLVGLVIVGTGLLLSLFELGVGRGTVYDWVLEGCWLLSLPTLILLTKWWRPIVLQRIAARPEKHALFQWVRAEQTGLGSYPRGAVGGAYLLTEGILKWLADQAGEWEASRRVLAYLFRTEAARQAQAREGLSQGVPLAEARGKSMHPENAELEVLEEVAKDSLEELIEDIQSSTCTLAVVSGERGAGKTVALGRLHEHFGDQALYLSCPKGGLGRLLSELRKELALEVRASDEEIVKAINRRAPKVVIVDDLQRVIRPAIGGLHDLDRLVYMARDTDHDTTWVVAISTPAWSYVERARSERIAFDRVINLRPWSEGQIGKLLRKSNELASVRPNFDGLVVSRQLEVANEETTGRAERGYYRILWDYSGGNPGVALYWWQRSLYEDNHGNVSVRLFKPPDPFDLETAPLNVRFALRTILQLDWAHPRELAESLELAPAVVDEALRFAQGRGYLERDGERVRITWTWLRAITVALRRQHLITL